MIVANDNAALLRPHGQVWVNEGDVVLDSSINHAYTLDSQLYLHDAQIDLHEVKAINYFYTLFPLHFLFGKVIPCTNEALRNNNKAPTSEAEILRFIGITLVMALEPSRGGVNSYWDANCDDLQTTIQPKKFVLT